MEIVLLIGVIIFFLVVLVKSAEMVEQTFVFFAKKVKISEFFLGFVILGIVTSLPELSISVLSSQNVPQLSVGNLIGATIVLFTLVIGLSAIRYGKLEFKGKFAEKEVLIGITIISGMIVALLDQYLSVFEGVVLLSSYGLYIAYLSRRFSTTNVKRHVTFNIRKTYPLIFKAIIGITFLLISSSMIVRNAVELANLLSISPILIGILLLAIGTNLPELTILFISNKSAGEERLALGNFFGSACVNPGILGLLTILSGGIKFDNFIELVPSLTILTLTLIFFLISSWTGRRISRFEGILLTALYIAFLLVEFIVVVG